MFLVEINYLNIFNIAVVSEKFINLNTEQS
jgi:hypothetical protein